jgi:hypothetical protein
MKLIKILIILSFLFLVLYGCVDTTKEIIRDIKDKVGSSPLGKHCDEKNKVVCYELSNGTGFDCVQVEKPMCKKEEAIK